MICVTGTSCGVELFPCLISFTPSSQDHLCTSSGVQQGLLLKKHFSSLQEARPSISYTACVRLVASAEERMRNGCMVSLTQKDVGNCDISCSSHTHKKKKPSDSTEKIQEYFRRQLASVACTWRILRNIRRGFQLILHPSARPRNVFLHFLHTARRERTEK